MINAYEKRMLRVIDYIHENLDGDLSLDTLADVAAMSRFHWHRVFHGMTGETCAQAVRRIRLHRTACWLVQTDLPVAEVAAKAGYDNLQSFSRIFSQSYGQPPSVFRKSGNLNLPFLKTQKGSYPMFPISIENRPAHRLAALSHRGSYFEIGTVFEKAMGLFAARGQIGEMRGMAGLYHDDPDAVPEAELRSQGGIIVSESTEIAEPFEAIALPEGRYAVMHYKGPYSGLRAAYLHLFGDWMPKSGQEPADGPCVEFYLNNPSDTSPEDLLTDVCVPLK